MKTKYCDKRLIGAVLLTWLAFAQLAQAFYNPSSGKWLSRDPMGERGGINLYGFVNNEPSSQFDRDGRQSSMDNVRRQAFVNSRIECRPLFSQDPAAPSLGNQLQGYRSGSDLSRWFTANQGTTVDYWTKIGVDRLTRSIKSACAAGTNPESLSGNAFVNELITPANLPEGASDYDYWIPGWPGVNSAANEMDPDEMSRGEATKFLGRYVIHFRNIRIQRLHCACEPCFFWHGNVEITDTPGITSDDDGFRGKIGSAIGILTDSPPVVIARWRQSGVVCCNPKKRAQE